MSRLPTSNSLKSVSLVALFLAALGADVQCPGPVEARESLASLRADLEALRAEVDAIRPLRVVDVNGENLGRLVSWHAGTGLGAHDSELASIFMESLGVIARIDLVGDVLDEQAVYFGDDTNPMQRLVFVGDIETLGGGHLLSFRHEYSPAEGEDWRVFDNVSIGTEGPPEGYPR